MTGIILAGGRSSRMGKDKAQLPWKKGTLLTATVDKLAKLCQEVIVVGPNRPLDREVRWTEDRYLGKGPLAGLHAGLEEAAFDSALVLPCDMPTISLNVMEDLIRLAKGVDLVLPVHSGGYEPLCAWYSRGVCLPVIRDLLAGGHTSPLDILPRVRICKLEVEKVYTRIMAEQFFANLNAPVDYEAAIREAAASGGKTLITGDDAG